MTVQQSVSSYVVYLGNGMSKLFDVSFPSFEDKTISAAIIAPILLSVRTQKEVIPLVQNEDYALSDLLKLGVDAKLTLVDKANNFNPPQPDIRQEWLDQNGNLKDDYYLFISFSADAFQPGRFSHASNYTPIVLENSLDRLTMAIKSLQRITMRGVKISLTDAINGGIDAALPTLSDNPGRYLRVNDEGDGFDVGFTSEEIRQMISDSGGIPAGGLVGDMIVKNSLADGDAVWVSFARSGFSNRYNQQVNFPDLASFLDFHLDITYAPPSVSLSASGSGLREKGTPVTATTLSANVTRRSEDIIRIAFYQGATLLFEDLDPNPNSGVTTYNWAGSFSDNTTFSVQVTDATNNTVSDSITFNFVYPYYFGGGVPSLTAGQISALTKEVRTNNNSIEKSFTVLDGQVFYFGFPAAYGALTSILDQNGFETFGSWTQRTVSITGLDGTPQSYLVYEFNNVQVANTTSFTFRR